MSPILQIAVQTVLNLLLLALAALKAFGSTYFTEKGRNLATREDVAGITREVEQVKAKFMREIEELKTDLQFSNQMKISLRTETKNTVVDLYEKLILWVSFLEAIALEITSELSASELKQIISTCKQKADTVVQAQAKSKLYVTSEDFTVLTQNLRVRLLEWQTQILRLVKVIAKQKNEVEKESSLIQDETELKHFERVYHANVLHLVGQMKDEQRKQIQLASDLLQEFREHCQGLLQEPVQEKSPA